MSNMRNFFTLIILSSFLSLPLHAHGPTRQQVAESVIINAPTDKVWAVVSDFTGLHKWHPAIKSTEMKGADVRVLELAPDKKVTEKLVKLQNDKMKLKYKITDMSIIETFEFAGLKVERKVLPVSNYTGFLSVVAEGEGSKVTWKGKFYRPYLLNPPTPEGMSDKESTGVMSAVYKAGLDNLKSLIEKGGITAPETAASKAPAAPTSEPAAPVAPTSTAKAPAAPAAPAATPAAPVAPVTVVSSTTKTTTKTKTVNSDGSVTTTKTKTKTKIKTKGAFDPANSYVSHVKCTDGKKCKIDKFLLKGFRAFSQCQVCHGMDGNGSTIAPSLMDKLKNEVTYDVFIDRVSNGFTGQIGVMPPWEKNPNIMKKINNLYAYLKARSDGVIPAGRLKKFKH